MANRKGDVDLSFEQVSAPQLDLWLDFGLSCVGVERGPESGRFSSVKTEIYRHVGVPTGHCMPFGVPMVWMMPTNHSTDCYFSMVPPI